MASHTPSFSFEGLSASQLAQLATLICNRKDAANFDAILSEVGRQVDRLGGLHDALRHLRRMGKPIPSATRLPVWKRLRLGTRSTFLKYRADLDVREYGFFGGGLETYYLFEELRRFRPAQTTHEVDLVRLSAKDLGFIGPVSHTDVYAIASKMGLELCTPEVGPALRRVYRNQPVGETLYVGMEAIERHRASTARQADLPRKFGFALHRESNFKDYRRTHMRRMKKALLLKPIEYERYPEEPGNLRSHPLVQGNWFYVFVRPRPK